MAGMNDLGKSSQYRLTAAKTVREADGRKHRSQKSQTLIVNALLELVAKGNLAPSADQIADAAKVGRRSVFRHFNDMDTLYREMSHSIAATTQMILQRPLTAADWRGQVLELVDRRSAGFEKMKPFLLAGRIQRHRSAYLKSAHAKFVGLLREVLTGILPEDVLRDAVLVEALNMLLSFEAWNRLRDDQGLSVAKAKHVLKQTIEALLQCHAREASGRPAVRVASG
jgi:AcrR family transcriptional regulator